MKLDLPDIVNSFFLGFLIIFTLFLCGTVVIMLFKHPRIWINVGITCAIPLFGFICYLIGKFVNKKLFKGF